MSEPSLPKRLKARIAAMRSAETGKEGKLLEQREPLPICGAKSKNSGQPCKQTRLYPNGRCQVHGGPSTGPKTAAGREVQMRNLTAINERRAIERGVREAADARCAQEEQRRREHPPSIGAPASRATEADDPLFPLADELRRVLREVGPDQYAHVTAREFSVGKYSGRRSRPGFARS